MVTALIYFSPTNPENTSFNIYGRYAELLVIRYLYTSWNPVDILPIVRACAAVSRGEIKTWVGVEAQLVAFNHIDESEYCMAQSLDNLWWNNIGGDGARRLRRLISSVVKWTVRFFTLCLITSVFSHLAYANVLP